MDYDKFVNILIDYYKNTKIPNNKKREIMDKIFIDNPYILTEEFVRERSSYCLQCGKCCIEQKCPALSYDNKCNHFNTENRSDVCFEFPFSDLVDGCGLLPAYYCNYALKVAIDVLNVVFIKYLEKEE